MKLIRKDSLILLVSALALFAIPAFANAQSCSISVTPTTIYQGQSATVTVSFSDVFMAEAYSNDPNTGHSPWYQFLPGYQTSWTGSYPGVNSCTLNLGQPETGYGEAGDFFNFIPQSYGYCGGVPEGSYTDSFTVEPTETTSYSGWGENVNPPPYPSDWTYASCNSQTLTVLSIPPPPTCSVTLTPGSVPYGSSATLSYSSTNTTSFYINSIGYVGASGSTSVGPSSTTDYSGSVSGAGGTATCLAALTVTPPSSPTVTITAATSLIQVGQSTTISANYTAGSSDSITNTTINVGSTSIIPYSSATSRSYTFTPASPGVTTFLAYAQTGYFPSWTSYAQVNVTAIPAPSCTVSLSPTSVTQGQSSTLTYASSNANSFSIDNVGSLTPDTSGSTSVDPSSSTDYTGTVSSGGVTNYCTAPSTSPAGTLAVSCTPTYSCSGSTIEYTNSSCNTSAVTSCASPAFCAAGSSSCIYPTISFNPSGNLSGDLQLVPNIVYPGDTMQVYWNVSNAQSCTVQGTNGDSWTGFASPTGGETSSPITARVSYKLSCLAYGSNPNVTQTQAVNVTPLYEEK